MFSEFDSRPREWKIQEASFGEINLIVGKNASGKTRLLNVINGLAKLLSGERRKLYECGYYKITFEYSLKIYEYELEIDGYEVKSEKFTIDDDVVLERGETGEGEIKADELGKKMRFQTPITQLAAVNRRDSLQHPFIDELYKWATSVKHYLFGSEFGKNLLMADSGKDKDSEEIDKEITDPNYVIKIFRNGLEKYGEVFKGNILKDLSTLGYNCTDISISNVSEYFLEKSQLLALSVQEKDLIAPTSQINMSQGMFRSLALAIQLNYTISTKQSACILVDDIGEGLDFRRSSGIINLLIEKAKDNKFQLFMTTNDRFVMNGVLLEYWSILHREGSVVRVFNKNNSAKIFEEFEYVGLNNFDFFSSEYFLGGKK
jgi:energy-coupling factor transporter ATP-binding protein EcfA2